MYFVSLETDTKKSVERSIRKEIKTLGSISVEGNPSDIQYNSNFDLLKVVKSFSGIDACSSGWEMVHWQYPETGVSNMMHRNTEMKT